MSGQVTVPGPHLVDPTGQKLGQAHKRVWGMGSGERVIGGKRYRRPLCPKGVFRPGDKSRPGNGWGCRGGEVRRDKVGEAWGEGTILWDEREDQVCQVV